MEPLPPVVVHIPMNDLVSRDTTRLKRDEAHINALADDFRQRRRDWPDEHPVKNPLRVLREGDAYVIIAGTNRWLAGLRVPLKDMPCIVEPRGLDEAALLIEEAKDNQLHQGYTKLELARIILRVKELRRCNQAEAGRLVGINNPAEVTKLLSVVKNFPEELHALIGEGDGFVRFTTAHDIQQLYPDVDKIRELTDKVIKGFLKRDAAEDVVKGLLKRSIKPMEKTLEVKAGPVSMTLPGAWGWDPTIDWLTKVLETARRAAKLNLPPTAFQSLLNSQ